MEENSVIRKRSKFDNYDRVGFQCVWRVERKVRLGLVLVWSRTRGSLAFLQLIFGLSRTGIEVYLRFGKRLLVKLLSRDINSKLGMPTRMRVEAYKEAVIQRRRKEKRSKKHSRS